jgi:hypothetical protein
VNRHIAHLGEDLQRQGELVVSAADDFSFVDRHVLAWVRGQQLGEQPLKRLMLALPFRRWGVRNFNAQRL